MTVNSWAETAQSAVSSRTQKRSGEGLAHSAVPARADLGLRPRLPIRNSQDLDVVCWNLLRVIKKQEARWKCRMMWLHPQSDHVTANHQGFKWHNRNSCYRKILWNIPIMKFKTNFLRLFWAFIVFVTPWIARACVRIRFILHGGDQMFPKM